MKRLLFLIAFIKIVSYSVLSNIYGLSNVYI